MPCPSGTRRVAPDHAVTPSSTAPRYMVCAIVSGHAMPHPLPCRGPHRAAQHIVYRYGSDFLGSHFTHWFTEFGSQINSLLYHNFPQIPSKKRTEIYRKSITKGVWKSWWKPKWLGVKGVRSGISTGNRPHPVNKDVTCIEGVPNYVLTP